ncbi:methionyl-tRNA formyltransferase [Candidatus Dojkabacteria bacterium]|nr:methionyl-tRNA formyltransferase [Candidatus Dojkabacteria bacterium]
MLKTINTLFIGTSEFAVPIIEKLFSLEYINVAGVVTQPDRPVGRNQKISPPPVKLYLKSKQESSQIFQPENITQTADTILAETTPELVIVASYGQFIPEKILNYPKYKCLNIHVSLLPKLRGAVPIPISIWRGFSETGVTIQVMEKEMDVGDIIATKKFPIQETDTTDSLTKKASIEGANLLEEILPDWLDGNISPRKQDHAKATYCFISDISKENAEIDWNKTSDEIERMVRALYPWPVAWFELDEQNTSNEQFHGKVLKVYKSLLDPAEIKTIIASERYNKFQIGELFKHKKRLFVKTGDGALELTKVQMQGKKKMPGKNYLFLI